MTCKWDVETLNNYLIELYNRRLKAKNLNDIYEIDLALNIIEDMQLEREDPESLIYEKINYVSQLKDAVKINNFYRRFYLPIRNFDLAWDSSKIFTPKMQQAYSLKDIKMSDDDIFELINNFYMSLPPVFREEFIRVFNSRFNRFEFRSLEKDEEAHGFTYNIPQIEDIFFTVSANQSYRKLDIAVHEFAHGIGILLNQYRACSAKNILDEVESYFFDMISKTYFARELKSSLPMFFLLEEINTALVAAEKVNDFNTIVKLYEENNKPKNKWNIEKDVFRKTGFRKDYISSMFSEMDLVADYHYSFSFLVATELENIYIKDPEKALFLLKKIILLNDKETSVKKLRELNIHLNEHVKPLIRYAQKRLVPDNKSKKR